MKTVMAGERLGVVHDVSCDPEDITAREDPTHGRQLYDHCGRAKV